MKGHHRGAVETLQAIYLRWPEVFREGFRPEDFQNPDQLSTIEWLMRGIRLSPLTAPLRQRRGTARGAGGRFGKGRRQGKSGRPFVRRQKG